MGPGEAVGPGAVLGRGVALGSGEAVGAGETVGLGAVDGSGVDAGAVDPGGSIDGPGDGALAAAGVCADGVGAIGVGWFGVGWTTTGAHAAATITRSATMLGTGTTRRMWLDTTPSRAVPEASTDFSTAGLIVRCPRNTLHNMLCSPRGKVRYI